MGAGLCFCEAELCVGLRIRYFRDGDFFLHRNRIYRKGCCANISKMCQFPKSSKTFLPVFVLTNQGWSFLSPMPYTIKRKFRTQLCLKEKAEVDEDSLAKMTQTRQKKSAARGFIRGDQFSTDTHRRFIYSRNLWRPSHAQSLLNLGHLGQLFWGKCSLLPGHRHMNRVRHNHLG